MTAQLDEKAISVLSISPSRPDPANGPHISQARLLRDLAALGVERGMDIVAHTGLSHIGWVEGGPNGYVEALIEAVGAALPDSGTILFPSHSGGLENPDNPAFFDVRRTPTRYIGKTPEAARLHPLAKRSLHGTHAVAAIGSRAAHYLAPHFHSRTPMDALSPYARLADAGGYILLVGTTHNCNSSFHVIEEALNLPYHLVPGVGVNVVVDENGVERAQPSRYHSPDAPRDFRKFDDELTRRKIQRAGNVGYAGARLVNAAAFRDRMMQEARRDPECFLEK